MQARDALIIVSSCLVLTMMVGCAQPDPERVLEACQKISKSDYSKIESKAHRVFRTNLPLTVLVLPPVNQSADVDASYKYLSSVIRPLTKAGYDVVPLAAVDAYIEENGPQTPAKLHNVPLEKLDQEFVADAVLYLYLEKYDAESFLVWSKASVKVRAKLIDLDTGVILWHGSAEADNANYNDDYDVFIPIPYEWGSGLKHHLARRAAASANRKMFSGRDGLLYGPKHANAGQAPNDVWKRNFYGREGTLGRVLGRYHPCTIRNEDEHSKAMAS